MSKIVPEQQQGRNQQPKITKFKSEQFDEKAIFLCQFCGGEKCPQEDYLTNKIQPNAIDGLHSNWITYNILAMQRPSERIIKQFNIYERFKKQNIKTILNLQEPGEHPYCGDGIIPLLGFSYSPEGFFKHGIAFFNESWEDMTATTFQHMMGIMNIFHNSLLDSGKISVHCHAGRGRTLLVICSWLIYNDRLSAEESIELAVERRQGVLTRSSQREFLKDFAEQLKKRWVSFGLKLGSNFSEFVENQRISFLRHEQKLLKLKPYVHTNIINELRRRMRKNQGEGKKILTSFLNARNPQFLEWSHNVEQELQKLKDKANDHTLFKEENKKIVEEVDCRILTEMLYDFYDEMPYTLLNIHCVDELIKGKKENKLQSLLQPQIIYETGINSLLVLLDFVHFLKELTNISLKLLHEEDLEQCDCLFLRISIVMFGKRKYFPKIFPPKNNGRQCRILKYPSEKRQKYLNDQIIYLSDFMRSMTKEVPEDLDDMDGIILKMKNVDVNLYRETINSSSKEGFFKKEEASKMFDKSRISL